MNSRVAVRALIVFSCLFDSLWAADPPADIRDLKLRVTNVEEGLAGVHRRLDRTDARLDRIERRLDLADLPHQGMK